MLKKFFLPEKLSAKGEGFLFALFVLALVSSLFEGIKVPLADAAPYNFIIPGASLGILAAGRNELSRVWSAHKALVILFTLLFFWLYAAAFLSPFRASILKYPFKYSQVWLSFLAMLCYVRHKELTFRSFRFVYRFMVALAIAASAERLFHYQMLPFLQLFRPASSLAVFPRVAGLMMWPNQLGVLSAMTAALGAILWKKGWLGRAELLAGTFILLLEISLSGSRNAWLNAAIALFLCWPYGILDFRKLVCAAAVWTVLMFSFAVPVHQLGIEKNAYLPFSQHFPNIGQYPGARAEQTIEQMPAPAEAGSDRVALWKEGLRLWSRNPVTGIGLFGFSVNWEQKTGLGGYNLHNLPLNMLVELGIAGTLLGAAFLVSFLQGLKWSDPLVTIPIILFFTSQIVDCFLYDITFLLVFGFMFAAMKVNYGQRRG